MRGMPVCNTSLSSSRHGPVFGRLPHFFMNLSMIAPTRVDNKPRESGDYRTQANLAFIQHKSHETICIPEITFLVDLTPKSA
jgi:hypothetical protein